jgi:hypothetical protein
LLFGAGLSSYKEGGAYTGTGGIIVGGAAQVTAVLTAERGAVSRGDYALQGVDRSNAQMANRRNADSSVRNTRQLPTRSNEQIAARRNMQSLKRGGWRGI